MPKHNLSPHFDSFPFSKTIEKIEILYFLVVLFFRHPLLELNELHGFAVYIVT